MHDSFALKYNIQLQDLVACGNDGGRCRLVGTARRQASKPCLSLFMESIVMGWMSRVSGQGGGTDLGSIAMATADSQETVNLSVELGDPSAKPLRTYRTSIPEPVLLF